jgi:hypothetical protein
LINPVAGVYSREIRSLTVSESGDQAAPMSAASEAQARRVLALKRAYQRELAHKPTLIQKTLIDRAAVLTAKAEAAALDPTVTANDLVRLDNKAERARAEMFESIKREEELPTLEEMLAKVDK